MKSIRLLLLLASGVTTGAFAQSGGLTDMSQSRFAKMANTELGAVHWTDGFYKGRTIIRNVCTLFIIISYSLERAFIGRKRKPVFKKTGI